ncbi:carbon storage regulator [Paenibacillus sp. 598K]|uniref:carbon storage regulator n=1 Tax=Paenibacillus sp. 598K TaxID=1117987 RepID=UPI000FFA5F45|nr:carbon storage regulator [Paenibacillus sp. 598K]GBF74706.1 carbon storage regulator [Paenibacillus sp. 598K]
MLVVGRKPGQSIIIDNRIVVSVIMSEDGQLRLAIDAPRDVPIVRSELLERNQGQP